MRRAFGLLLVPALCLGFGACADEPDDFIGRPVEPGVAPSHEPLTNTLIDNGTPLERQDTAVISDDVALDRATFLGIRSRALYDRLRAAGLVR